LNNKITETDITNAFREVILKDDKVIVLYSGLWSFIFNIKFNSRNIGKSLLNLLEKIVTKKRTIILPSFSGNAFLKSKQFHIDTSLDRNGILPKEALKSKKYFRTPQPIHSYLVLGKHKKEISKLKFKTSWGKKSLFEWLKKKNARLVVFGVPWNKGCSYLHRFEELNLVPWRYFKEFKGNMYKNKKKIGICKEIKYSKYKNLKYDLNPIVKSIDNKMFLKSSSKKFFLESITCNEIDRFAEKFFKKNAWKIVKNKKEIKKLIKFKNLN